MIYEKPYGELLAIIFGLLLVTFFLLLFQIVREYFKLNNQTNDDDVVKRLGLAYKNAKHKRYLLFKLNSLLSLLFVLLFFWHFLKYIN